jgi:hypothetical protein
MMLTVPIAPGGALTVIDVSLRTETLVPLVIPKVTEVVPGA